MSKLEILLKDGGVEEFETQPVVTQQTTPTQPAINGKQAITTTTLLTTGKQAINAGIGLTGEVTGDYALERKIKGGLTALGMGVAIYTAPQIAIPALAIQQTAEAVQRNRAIFRKQFQAQQNQVITGETRSNNSRIGGRK